MFLPARVMLLSPSEHYSSSNTWLHEYSGVHSSFQQHEQDLVWLPTGWPLGFRFSSPRGKSYGLAAKNSQNCCVWYNLCCATRSQHMDCSSLWFCSLKWAISSVCYSHTKKPWWGKLVPVLPAHLQSFHKCDSSETCTWVQKSDTGNAFLAFPLRSASTAGRARGKASPASATTLLSPVFHHLLVVRSPLVPACQSHRKQGAPKILWRRDQEGQTHRLSLHVWWVSPGLQAPALLWLCKSCWQKPPAMTYRSFLSWPCREGTELSSLKQLAAQWQGHKHDLQSSSKQLGEGQGNTVQTKQAWGSADC